MGYSSIDPHKCFFLGLRMLLHTLKSSISALKNVGVLFMFLVFIFATIGTQAYMGSFFARLESLFVLFILIWNFLILGITVAFWDSWFYWPLEYNVILKIVTECARFTLKLGWLSLEDDHVNFFFMIDDMFFIHKLCSGILLYVPKETCKHVPVLIVLPPIVCEIQQ